jgi:bacillithiol biosynthesis cysteine-adding enzyme BshC
VPIHPDAPAAAGVVRDAVPFDRFPWIRPLVAAHARGDRALDAVFAGRPADPAAWQQAIARVQAHPSPSRALAASVVHAQVAERAAPAEALEAAARLADPAAVAIVTGQQAGLFGGPLYTLLKALTTIQLARRVQADHRTAAVPVFWVDAEDHDWDEVRTAQVLDREGAQVAVTLGDLPGAGSLPVGSLRLDDDVSRTIGQLEASLAPTEFTPGLVSSLARHYRAGVSVAAACASWLDELLGPLGLVVFDASDARAKPAVADVFRREIETPCGMARLARTGGETLAALGHQAQIDPGDDMVCLFYLDDAGRRPIRHRQGRFFIEDEPREAAGLAEEAARHPDRFSPNVLLRPLVQDTLFPTVCYVAGPSELAYQAQLGDAYRTFGIPQPLLVSRASATLLDSAAARFLERHPVPLETLQPQDESALNRLLETQLPASLEGLFAEIDARMTDGTTRLKDVVTGVDPTLGGAVDTTLDRARETFRNLHGKIVSAAKKKDETLRRQFTRTRGLAFPGGAPQERVLNLAFFINRYGPGLPARLLDVLPPLADAHYVITP